MNELIHIATAELTRFLSVKLPELSGDWWQKHVVDRLSFQQQRMVQERGHKSLQQLDFAALLRVLDQNWYELANRFSVSREGRNWVKELQTVRNKWAHLSAEAMPASEMYRDIDTLGRLLAMLGASQASLDNVEASKNAAVAAMTNTTKPAAEASTENVVEVQPFVAQEPTGKIAEVATSRVTLFNVGDLVALRSSPETILPVIEVIPGGGESRYRVFQNNAKQTYYESQLQAPAVTADERKSLSTVELHAHLTSLQILSPSTANLFSLRSGRINFVPYQYRPVLKLIRADRPRLLIADEVGVGKTIEAGLIIKELRARLDLSSVLIICPKALVAERKWSIEMKRFDEHFTPLDGRLLKHCLQETLLEGEWPEQYAKAILPFSLFDSELVLGRDGQRKSKDPGLVDLDPPPKFDLVIVDEAHHIRNSETYLHQGIRFFCDNAEAALFLTATPVQLGSDDLYTLLNVLRPDLIIDRASFEQMAAPNRHINAAVQHCRLAKGGWQNDARGSLDAVAQTEWGRLFLRESPAFQNIYDRLRADSIPDVERIKLVRSTEELYTFSSLINRTRRRDIGEFTSRVPETLTVEFTPAQKKLHDGLLDVIARILVHCHGRENVKFMMSTIRRQAASCLYGLAPFLKGILTGKLDRLEPLEINEDGEEPDLTFVDEIRADIAALLAMTENLDLKDPKVEAFVSALHGKSKMPNNKALVFSTFRHTLAYLAQQAQRTGLRIGLIHGSVPDDERADLRRRFALPKEQPEAIDVLLSSEVGCEGLDFQFCDFLINYDLPWNPMRIEQRIGRIDRYGQKSETVAIINFVTPGTVEAEIYQRCLLRIGVFRHSIGGSEEILGRISQQLRDVAETFILSPEERDLRLQQIADNSIRKIQEDEELEKKEAELFGLNIPNSTWRKEIEDAENYWLSAPAIERCVTAYLAARVSDRSVPPQWAISATQKYSNVDRFLSGLEIKEWDVPAFIERLQERATFGNWRKPDGRFLEWLAAKPLEWHQKFYALLNEDLPAMHPEYRRKRAIEKLSLLQIVRLCDGKYSIGSECFFLGDVGEYEETLPRVANGVYSFGKNKSEQEAAKSLLEAIGVREVGKAEQVQAILKQRYTAKAHNPSKKDLEKFVSLVEKDPPQAKMFREYLIFERTDSTWGTPSQVFLDAPYLETGLGTYFSALGKKATKGSLSAGYRKGAVSLERLCRFAECVGVQVRLEITGVSCVGNPAARELTHSALGGWSASKGINRDFTIEGLSEILPKQLEALARLVWKTLCERKNNDWLRAQFRNNSNHPIRESASQLVCLLRDIAWVPQIGGAFVCPAKASRELLPKGFPYDAGFEWLKEIKFGADERQRSDEYKKQQTSASDLGFVDLESLDRAQRFARLPFTDQNRILEEFDRRQSLELPDHTPRNQERRAELVGQQAAEAQERLTEVRRRSVAIGREDVKQEAAQYLSQRYTNRDGKMICQICRSELPFKLKDGSYYFESVEFLPELKRRHPQNYLALCPLHSAMFQYANGSRDVLKRLFASMEGLTFNIVLAQSDATLYFNPTHLADLRAVMAADAKEK